MLKLISLLITYIAITTLLHVYTTLDTKLIAVLVATIFILFLIPKK